MDVPLEMLPSRLRSSVVVFVDMSSETYKEDKRNNRGRWGNLGKKQMRDEEKGERIVVASVTSNF